MLSEEQFLELARSKYKEIAALEAVNDFYTYEKQFEQVWIELGHSVLEQSISTPPQDRRKKKTTNPLWHRGDKQSPPLQ